MAKTKSEKLAEVFDKAKQELGGIVEACEHEREQSLEDRRFYSISGAQWEGSYGEQFANRPKLEVNKIHLSVIRIFNEYRNNRISATFIPKDGKDGQELADLCAGLYRADQQDSRAEEAYDNAFEEAVGGGMGAWRLTHEYEDEYDAEDERQRIRFEPIYDADTTVFFDVGAKRQDKSDARHCFVLSGMSRDAYIEEWGDDPASWDRPVTDTEFDWESSDLVYVAEYYRVEEKKETVYTYRNISGETEKYTEQDFKDDPELESRLNNVGTIRVASRPVKRKTVHKYIMSGAGVLEDCGTIAGTEIPIIPVYGKRWYIDGKERFMGHVRLAKDAQRLKNMQLSVLAETSAVGGISTPIFTPEQIAGHEQSWASSAVDRPAYLMLNPITDADGNEQPAGPVGFKEPPTVPQAMAALLEISEGDIADILGNQQNGDEIEANISGKAVELIQNRLDMQAYIYMSNFAKAERRCAEIWLGMARELYADEERTMKTIDDQEAVDFVDLGRKVLNDKGEPVVEADMSRAKFDVTVEIGPTSTSRRSATVRALTQMLSLVADPADQKVISAMAMMNMEGEGIQPVRDYFRRQMVQMGVVEPTDEELEEMQAAAQQASQPTPEQEFIMAETQKALAEAQHTAAETEETQASAAEKRAKTIKTLADIDREAIEAAASVSSDLAGTGTTPPEGVRQQGTTPPQ